DGIPLFMEELTKALLETGEARGARAGMGQVEFPALHAIPATLHGSLISRLDRLGVRAKEVAQIGAVLGREFSYDLIQHTSQLTPTELMDALDRLSVA